MSSVSPLASPVDHVSQSLSCQQFSNPRHENINFAVDGSNRTRVLAAAGASALVFCPSPSRLSPLIFAPFVCLARTRSPRRASPSSSNQFLFIRHRDAAPNGRSQNIKCLTSSSFVWAAGSPRTHTKGRRGTQKTQTHTHTHACLCCVTASQGRSQQTNKGFLLALTSHFHAEKSEEAPTQQPASESQAQEC